MEEQSKSALKEWAAIEQILAAGHTSLLLRKGGIRERKRDFEVDHREFWLFPTHYHQNPDELVPGFKWALQSGRAAEPDGDHVRIEHYAVVQDAFRVEDPAVLRRLEGLHPLTSETVESRFHYRDRLYLHVLLLRVYRLQEPYVIPNTLDYEGCISWVELDDPLSTIGAIPVLDDLEFAAAREKVLEAMGEAGWKRV